MFAFSTSIMWETSLNRINSIVAQRSTSNVVREKHKAVRQSKASITEKYYHVTVEENRWYNLKWSIKSSNPSSSQVLIYS